MYPKRRITVQPVDAARLCGDNNGAVVSFLNCINHRVTDTPTTDLDEPLYLPSRVMVHAYAGALLVDAAVEAHQYIEEAAVNAAAVVACRVMPLRASGESSSATYSAHAGGPTKIVFFSGCQRLAEVLIDDVAAVTSSSPMRMNSCPMQCFRVEFGGSAKGMVALDMATFLKDPQTLCACTPQLGKIQMLSFEGDAISCMGPGRPGSAEVTVILSSNVAVLCGVPPTALEPWTSSAEEDPEEPAVLRASRAARQTFLAANEHSSTQVLQTIPLPSHLSSSATPLRVAWSGAATLWAIYSDGSVVAVQCVEREGIDNSAEDDDELQRPSLASSGARPASQARCSLVVSQVLETKLAAVCAQNSDFNELVIGQAEIHADPRAPALHFAVVTTDAGGTRQQHLYYGTVRLQVASAAAHLQLRQYQIRYGEQLYGVRFERGRFHILSQSTRGAGPLYVVTLPKDGPSVSSAEAGAASDAPSLAKTIMECAESELSSYCRNCEALLKELRAKAQQLTCEQDAELLLKRLMEAQHALYALLTRQQQSVGVKDLAPNESLPYRLLQRASQLFCELSVYTLFVHLGIMDTISRPVRDVLRLSEAAAMSEKAQTQWASLIRDTFRHESVYQSSVAEMAAWQAAATLCVDVLLDRLGLSAADASCTMTSVLARIGALTPDMALFILYYSYVGLEKGGGAKSAPATSSRAVQQQQRQWRESFLLLFSMPVELSLWAFTCYAVDHGVNPAKVTEGVQDSFVYVMGPAVQHLGAPPFVNLLAPVVNGLSHVGALDVILRLIPTCIAVYTAASTSVPMAVAIRLLCVAVRAGSARMIEALYEVMRGSSELRHLAGQPLAYAALHAGNVSAMRGWVEVGSPVAETIERTLQTAEGGVRRREAVLIPFYILLQRYEDALQICSSTTAADATQAQRLQVVQSYLRSFLSASSEAWGEKKSTVGADVDPRLPVDGASSLPLWRPTTLAAPLLQVGFCKLAEQLARAALSVGEHSSTNGATSAPASRALAEASAAYQSLYGAPANGLQTHARPPVFRPSTLLSSVERGSGAGSSSSPCSPPGAGG
ncbi:hypothetical protein JKF63_02641 [Porcisia hertigi]|uniref:Uncharacterized protein n=1 Tax=Porcisia hertigi TaxID=2761500 RepID=A0A836L2Y8_9TRYP|nr:hypothetical protein JKF63_02641 [Porcisia hertigi]